MNRITLLAAMVFLLGLAVLSFAGSPLAKIRVVNISALGAQNELTDDELRNVAIISLSENPEIFPDIVNFVIWIGTFKSKYSPNMSLSSGPIKFSGSIEEKEALEFISLPDKNKAGKFDMAIVKPDGKVIKFDEEIVIDYKKRSIKTSKPINVEDGDVLLVFVKKFVRISFPDAENNYTTESVDPVTGRPRDPSPNQNRPDPRDDQPGGSSTTGIAGPAGGKGPGGGGPAGGGPGGGGPGGGGPGGRP